MKDQLEDFIRENRGAFDDREPSSRVWGRIERSLALPSRGWRQPVYLWRAAAIFFMALSVFLYLQQPLNRANKIAMKEFSDVEAFYTQQISNKVELIQEFPQSEGVNGYTHDFQQLEAMYLVLKEEMKARPSQKVKDALVLNLLVRIDLLNKQLQQLEERKEAKKEERRT